MTPTLKTPQSRSRVPRRRFGWPPSRAFGQAVAISCSPYLAGAAATHFVDFTHAQWTFTSTHDPVALGTWLFLLAGGAVLARVFFESLADRCILPLAGYFSRYAVGITLIVFGLAFARVTIWICLLIMGLAACISLWRATKAPKVKAPWRIRGWLAVVSAGTLPLAIPGITITILQAVSSSVAR